MYCVTSLTTPSSIDVDIGPAERLAIPVVVSTLTVLIGLVTPCGIPPFS